MSDADIETAVAPFWRDYPDEIAALRAEADYLRAENARLRAALKAAPLPMLPESANALPGFAATLLARWEEWYDTTRREALDG